MFSDSPFWPFPAAARADGQGGGIHVVWAEPVDTATVFVDGFPPEATRLYHRRYSTGRWSARRLVAHHPGGIMWNDYPPPRLLIDRQNRLHVVYNVRDDAEKAGTIHYARKDEHGWAVIDTGHRGAYPALAIESSGRLLLALVAGKLPDNPQLGDQDHNSVLLSISTDQGTSWSEPALVSRSGMRRAHMPHFVQTPSGTIHLLWAKDAGIGRGGRVIWHATSEDAVRWSVPREIGTALGGLIHTFRAVGASDTCMHLFFERETALLEGDRKLYYARWDGKQWTEPQDLFKNSYSSTFDAAMAEDGTLHLVWMRAPTLRWGAATLEDLSGPEDWPLLSYSINRPTEHLK